MAAILVHGGAGDYDGAEDPRPYEAGCLAAARVGHQVLAAGGSALDAVLAAVTVLEDDPLFNAGTGAALNLHGEVELDASVMGGDGRAGAVAAVRGVKNPARLARLVMEKTPHVMLCGSGAVEFAVEQGVSLVPEASLITEASRAKWAKAVASRGNGTVGAVACDSAGRVAAATSTGGMVLKRRGRIGDSPLIGCGTYADDALGAASCTGVGEAIIKAVLAKAAVDRLGGAVDVSRVAAECVGLLTKYGGDGGIILATPNGQLGHAFNSRRMARAWVDDRGDGAGFG